MKRLPKPIPFALLFSTGGAILLSKSPVKAAGILQFPLCAKGCVTSYRSYTAWNGTAITTDNTRQGVNPYETQLRKSSLTQNNFKYQGAVQVDGQIYAQPLFMSGLNNSFVQSESAVFVATEHGSVYALNAFDLSTVVQRSLLPGSDVPVPQAELPKDSSTGVGCANITYEVGITGTPAIDPTPPTTSGNPVLFAVVKSKSGSLSYKQTLHAWDFEANTDVSLDVGSKLGWTTSPAANPNQYALMENQRAGLALSHDSSGNAIIYISWGSHCDSTSIVGQSGTYLYNGWVAAFKYDYSTSQFSLLSYVTDEPLTTGRAGIWMAGAAPAIDDATGNIFLATGNGSFSTTTTPPSLGESVLQLNLTASSPIVGSYTPNKWSTLNLGGSVTLPAPASVTVTLPNDQDLGSSGAVLLSPVGQTINSKGFEVLSAGKEGVAYILDPTLMSGGVSAADSHDPCTAVSGSQPVQCFQPISLVINGTQVQDASGTRVPPVFWGGDAAKGVTENFLYAAGSQDTELRYWQMNASPSNNGSFSTTIFATGKPPAHGSGSSFPYPGGGAALSWDDTASNPNASDAILWVVDSSGYINGKPAVLVAYPGVGTKSIENSNIFYDATNGPVANKFTVPVVVSGEVYVGGQGVASQCTVGSIGLNCGVIAHWSE